MIKFYEMLDSKWYHKLYDLRFELFFLSLVFVLFGSIIFPFKIFEDIIMPVLFISNICSGIILISKRSKLLKVFIAMVFILALLLVVNVVTGAKSEPLVNGYIRMGIYYIFYVTVTYEIITQVWRSAIVDRKVIIGLMSGYISLGLVSFFIFLSILMSDENAFRGLKIISEYESSPIQSLIYYSYITLLTIGYGDIVPVSNLAQKASILVGLMGQFYMVIITAVVIEKYIRHTHKQ
ncbi:MAG: hypothetical protein BM564_12530 [Bacteroidetes bacterium MedPE-SWsnd-G2]|nr:MAG: hypothetical protein BM564_12530 [Bacteroidetes bacterium MedPE-SWsnd-G2]